MDVENSFHGAVLILTDASQASAIATQVADSYFNTEDYHFTVTESTPTNVPENLRDLTTAHQVGLGVETSVLTVYPWAQAEVQLKGL